MINIMKKFTFKFLVLAAFFMMGNILMAQSPTFNLTFQVEMAGVPSFNSTTDAVYISGPTGWDQPGTNEALMLTPIEEGGTVYSLTLAVEVVDMVMYKYFIVSEGVPNWDHGEWGGDPNRTVYPTGDATYENVWANKPMSVTFNVNMSTATEFNPATDAVYVAGTMANMWAQPGTVSAFMLSTNDDVNYSLTLLVYPGNVEYKFFRVIDSEPSWDHGEWSGMDNRTVTVDSVALDLNDYWGQNQMNVALDGMWEMAPMAGALGVGPGMGDISWWSNSADDVITRGCYFDDIYYFAEDGAFENILEDEDHGFETWIEPWQGMDPEGCGTPVAPHNGSIAATWSYEASNANSGSLTLHGVGAYMGLAKVFNGGELSASADAPESITYMVTWNATEDTMTLDIAIADPGWWRFILVRADASGLNDNEYQVMEVYPNPASSVLNIKNHTDLESLHIYSVTGKMVLQTNDIDGTIDISDFATGLYAISALDKNGQKYQTKFIVK